MLIVKYGKRLDGDRGKQKKNAVSIFDCHYECLYRFDSMGLLKYFAFLWIIFFFLIILRILLDSHFFFFFEK